MDLKKLRLIQDNLEEIKSEKQHNTGTIKDLVLPFIEMLGFDLEKDIEASFSKDFRFNDDGGIDFLVKAEEPFVIEAKIYDVSLRKFENLNNRPYNAQLTTSRKILTDGRFYFMFKDNVFKGLVDDEHYYRVDITNVSEVDIEELNKFIKGK